MIGSSKKKKNFKNEGSLRNVWDNMNSNYLHHRGTRKRRRARIENLSEETMTKNFPNPVKEKNTQVQEVQKVLNKINPKKPTLKHIIVKMARVKDKERILKTARETQLSTREIP